MGRFPTYVVTMLALDLLGLSLAAGLFPPDAVTNTYALGVTLLTAPVVAYWLVYRDGFAYFQIRRWLGRDGNDGGDGGDESDDAERGDGDDRDADRD